MEKNKKLFMTCMSILLVLMLVIGGSYAWFTLQLNGTKTNVLRAGTLSLKLDDENSVGINSEKAVPMLDEVGEQLDPYHFTLINEGDQYVEYTIYFDDLDVEDGEVRMADNKVKYNLVKDTRSKIALLSTLGENPNRVLDHGTIKGGQTISYDLRLWIDSEASNEVMGQVVRGKLRVVATQVTETVVNEQNLSMSVIGGNGISFSEGVNTPLTDEEGAKLEPYYFSLKNTSGEESEYTVTLEDASTYRMRSVSAPLDKIKYQLKKNNEVIATDVLSETIVGEEKVLDTGVMEAGSTNNYELRLWLDSSVSVDDASSYSLQANLMMKPSQTLPPRNENIVAIYQYDSKTCLTGEEAACVEIIKAPKVYEAGTIIKYKVNASETKYFHVMFDEGDTLVIQQRENTIYDTAWNLPNRYKGPLTVLSALESATSGWTNVKDQTYTMGTTTFKTNAFTGCGYTECTKNTYTLESRTKKARMITVQEAHGLGCTNTKNSCPIWMNNYLYDATSNGGTVNKTGGAYGKNYGYWTMSAYSSDTASVMFVYFTGAVGAGDGSVANYGARAVVVIDK